MNTSPDRTRWSQVGNGESVTVRIVRAIAAELDRDPVEMPPLSEYVDIDALALLFEADRSGPLTVSFRYDTHEITVRSDETVSAAPLAASSSTAGSTAGD